MKPRFTPTGKLPKVKGLVDGTGASMKQAKSDFPDLSKTAQAVAALILDYKCHIHSKRLRKAQYHSRWRLQKGDTRSTCFKTPLQPLPFSSLSQIINK